ncbi:hypothetical protein [Prevotella sp. OH937_COT-195]|uniref:hypothetical protein n=1 Tax=Prevotella sp. OH937_COT-195 TaxID=2491051 RepID=UPI000F64DA7F|nr:hypothetical protein [Prevotella sp. OH937_COT-195]RRD01868.1 hypothetical protein EII32_05420 [Prevotella sp. OH937_COT-195]
MKTTFLIIFFSILSFSINAQEIKNDNTTTTDFTGRFFNEEHKIYLVINLKEKNVLIPNQEILGELDGYFGSNQTSHIWAITSSQIKKGNTATIEVINNYGSEDFKATLSIKENGTLEFQHINGSVFKFPVKNKWQKLPNKIVFVQKSII